MVVFSCGAVCCSALQCQCCSMLQIEFTVIMVSKVWFTDCIEANVDTSNVLSHIIFYIVTRQPRRIIQHIATHLRQRLLRHQPTGLHIMQPSRKSIRLCAHGVGHTYIHSLDTTGIMYIHDPVKKFRAFLPKIDSMNIDLPKTLLSPTKKRCGRKLSTTQPTRHVPCYNRAC